MIDLDRTFRDADKTTVADLWPEIAKRNPRPLPPTPPGRRAATIVIALLIAVAGVGFAIRVFTQDPTSTPGDQPPSAAPDFASLSVGGSSPTLSPDGTTIAFWRDPCQPNIDCSRPRMWNGNPYVLQVWLIDADGSDLRKVWQHPGCCIVTFPDLRWSKDGSSVVLIAEHKYRIDVTTGGSGP